MAVKVDSAIRRLEKNLTKLQARIDELSGELEVLKIAASATVTEPEAAAVAEEPSPGTGAQSSFSEDDVERAVEMTEDAGELEDILEKKKKKKKQKKKKKK